MTSGKQRKEQLKIQRKKKTERKLQEGSDRGCPADEQLVVVNGNLLAPTGSYSRPDFVERGYYLDVPFTCADCGKSEVWTARQQKWWYEVAKGDMFTRARRCRPCRRTKRVVKEAARRVHLDGIEQRTQMAKTRSS